MRETKTQIQRGVAGLLLLAAGIFSLPLVAAFLDGESTEDLIVPIQLAVMAVLGAIIGYLLPGVAGFGSSSARSAMVGAIIGVATALAGVAIFALLL
jgi:phosphate/sulfate permease